MKRSIKHVLSLLLAAALTFAFFPVLPAGASAASGKVRGEYFYTHMDTNELPDKEISIEVPLDEDILLADYFVETNYNGDKYKLERLIVNIPDPDPDKSTLELSADEVYDGATFMFPSVIYTDYYVQTFYTLDTDPEPDPAPAPSRDTGSGGDKTVDRFSLNYFNNIKPNEYPYAQKSHDKNTTAAIADSVPSRPGYTFLYWTLDPEGHGIHYAAGHKFIMKSDINLYAQWEPEIENEKEPETYNPDTGLPPTLLSRTLDFLRDIFDF